MIVGGNENDVELRIGFFQFLCELNAVDHRHFDIQKRKIKRLPCGFLQRLHGIDVP